MSDAVKRDRRADRRADTEGRLLTAAGARFVRDGYAATTLTDVAADAGVAPRTLYLHFATKAELLRRCIGAAIAGHDDTPLTDQGWLTAAMTARTLKARIAEMAAGTAQLMARTGDLIAVAQQAAAVEPELAAAAQAGREQTRATLLDFWQRASHDGLVPAKADLAWLSETGALLAHAETFLLVCATTGWDIATYQRWLADTWLRLARAA